MSTTLKIAGYQMRDAVRSRWLLGYLLFFAVATDTLLRFSEDPTKALTSLMNVALFIVPLVSVVFGTMFLYHAREFIEVLLAQPIARGRLYAGLYLGLTAPLALALTAGIGVPFVLRGASDAASGGSLVMLIGAGVGLTAAFTALAFLVAVRTDDRARGLGIAIALWLACTVLYDGLVLMLVASFADYPLERPMLGLMLANPVDLARVALLLRFDLAALMGYTGAVFARFFGTAGGMALATTALLAWIALPVGLGARAFRRKDF